MNSLLVILLFAISTLAYVVTKSRSRQLAHSNGGLRYLHSRPSYYATLAAMLSAIPALIIFAVWSAFYPAIVESMVMSNLPRSVITGGTEPSLLFSQIKHVADGITDTDKRWLIEASRYYSYVMESGNNIRFATLIAIAFAGLVLGLKLVRPKVKAREIGRAHV